MLNEGSKRMLDAVLAKSPEALNENEIAVLRARRSYLTDEQTKNFASVLAGADEAPKESKESKEPKAPKEKK